MRVLRILVVFMGALIVLGTGFLIYTLATGFRPTGGSYSSTVELPAGARLDGMVGLGDRLGLRLSEPGKPDRIMILDPARGRLLGTITIEAKP